MTELPTTFDGGPAFPAPPGHPATVGTEFDRGMTLRDYFACRAMEALISNRRLTVAFDPPTSADGAFNIDKHESRDALAFKAVQFADSLLDILAKTTV